MKNDTGEAPRLKTFDYGICAFGAIAAILMLRVFGDVPSLLRFLIGLFSIAICAFTYDASREKFYRICCGG